MSITIRMVVSFMIGVVALLILGFLINQQTTGAEDFLVNLIPSP